MIKKMIDLHIGRQTFDFDCGAQALQTVMAYYGVDVRGDELMKALGTGPKGTSVQALIAVAESYGFQVNSGNNWTLARLKGVVDEGYPVIVLLQAWADRFMTLDDWRRNYEDGHYSIVIGHDTGVLLFEDPASFRRVWLRDREFLARWHDRDPISGEEYHHFGMVLKGKPPAGKAVDYMG
ncbi:MAG: cysteine peptidase family C39 domain-containing protein [Syntrophales bacterium]|nr:cysteine peptidase family C39 domain-containing protein [Syntrophales bacterium]